MRGDLVLVATVAAYAAVNIALNGMFARGMLGRAPLGLMATLVFASALGAFASLALFLMAKPVWMTWRGTLCAAVLLGLLTWFNAVCLRDAATAAA